MTIKIIETHQQHDEYHQSYEIEIMRGDTILSSMNASDFLNENPEDATLSRDLSFIFNATDFLHIAYQAGKDNEELIWETKFLNEEDEEITAEEFNK